MKSQLSISTVGFFYKTCEHVFYYLISCISMTMLHCNLTHWLTCYSAPFNPFKPVTSLALILCDTTLNILYPVSTVLL